MCFRDPQSLLERCLAHCRLTKLCNVSSGTKRDKRGQPSLEPRLSVPDFVSQLWRKIGARQNLEQRAG